MTLLVTFVGNRGEGWLHRCSLFGTVVLLNCGLYAVHISSQWPCAMLAVNGRTMWPKSLAMIMVNDRAIVAEVASNDDDQ